MSTEKPVHTLVLDTGAIIRNEPSVSTLIGQSENLVTVPDIISEIKDAATRSRVETTLLPFLSLRSPNTSSVKFVTDFARKTGDLAVLSKPDIHIIALTYEIECERNSGDWRLRKVPGQKGLNGAPPDKDTTLGVTSPLPESCTKTMVNGPTLSQGSTDATDGQHGVPESELSTARESDSLPEEAVRPVADALDGQKVPGYDEVTESTTQITLADSESAAMSNETINAAEKAGQPAIESSESAKEILRTDVISDANESSSDVPTKMSILASYDESIDARESSPLDVPEPSMGEEASKIDSAQLSASTQEEDSGSGSEGWITPSNLKKQQAKDAGASTTQAPEPKTMQVAVLTTDFAMQNVILQINLNLLSRSMTRVKHLKTFVLRCHACFNVSKDMTKQFCPKCGQPTLTRVSCSTNVNGEFKLHLKKNMQWNTRGDRYSIPKAVHGASNGRIKGGGKGGWGNDLILTEDQKEYERASKAESRQKDRSLMDEDYLPSILTGDRARAGGRIKVGAGRHVNSKKR